MPSEAALDKPCQRCGVEIREHHDLGEACVEVGRWKANAKKEREYSLLVEGDNVQLRTALRDLIEAGSRGSADFDAEAKRAERVLGRPKPR